ncbi:MAG: TolC family protein [Treponema sp.]|nr:TolC family protein [Treponema sp.]
MLCERNQNAIRRGKSPPSLQTHYRGFSVPPLCGALPRNAPHATPIRSGKAGSDSEVCSANLRPAGRRPAAFLPRIAFLACILLLAVPDLRAQENPLGLEEVRILALAHSRGLARADLAVRDAALAERARVFALFPSLSLSAGTSLNLWNQTGRPNEGTAGNLSASLSLGISQKLFEGGKTVIQKEINRIAGESARQAALAEYFSVLDAADSAFYAVLQAEAVLEAEESSLQAALSGLAIAEIRLQSGMINQGELLQARARGTERENARNQARRNLALARSRLLSLTGLAELPALSPVDFSAYDRLIAFLAGIDEAGERALYERFSRMLGLANPSLAQAGLSSERAEQNLNLARRSALPGLSASLSTGLNLYPDPALGGGRLSLSANIPLDFWVTANTVQRSRLARDQSLLDLQSAEAALDLELRSALLSVFALAGSVLYSRLSLDYSERNFAFVEERHRLFQSSPAELGEAVTLLLTARNNLANAGYGFLQALSKLRSLGAVEDEQRLREMLLGE